MPRVEIIPRNWELSSQAKRGDGSPTIDLCKFCARDLQEGYYLPPIFQSDYPMWVAGSTDVAHPAYEEQDYGRYYCSKCGKILKEKDN